METLQLITEGVLVLASSEGLKRKYSNKEFDYDFPKGIQHLVDNNLIIALLTSEGDNINIQILIEQELLSENYDRIIEQFLDFEHEDEMLILSHADFTMLCNKGGDYQNYRWPVKKINIPQKGRYKLLIGVEDVSEEYEKYQAYFNLTISLLERKGELKKNQILEIG